MITIVKSPNADSRTATGPLTVQSLTDSTKSHQHDVSNALEYIAGLLHERAEVHDHTKLEMMDEFHAALTSGKVKESDWYQKHITMERHHLKSHVPEDVTLIDVIEHLCDCCMAGLARSGQIYDVDLSPELLDLAARNTVEMLKSNTTVVDNNDDDVMHQEIG